MESLSRKISRDDREREREREREKEEDKKEEKRVGIIVVQKSRAVPTRQPDRVRVKLEGKGRESGRHYSLCGSRFTAGVIIFFFMNELHSPCSFFASSYSFTLSLSLPLPRSRVPFVSPVRERFGAECTRHRAFVFVKAGGLSRFLHRVSLTFPFRKNSMVDRERERSLTEKKRVKNYTTY